MKKHIFFVIIAVFIFVSCAPSYSPYIYNRTRELKSQATYLMKDALKPYLKYSDRVEDLKSGIETIEAMENARRHNKNKKKQWSLMTNPDGHLLYGFLDKWQRDTVLTETFIQAEKDIVREAFDLLLETENELK